MVPHSWKVSLYSLLRQAQNRFPHIQQQPPSKKWREYTGRFVALGGQKYHAGLFYISALKTFRLQSPWCVCEIRAMSSAQCMDASSDNKSATLEGVTPCRSMLGYDLRILLSKRLSCKPGSRLVMHHVNGKLMLDKKLGDQGIKGLLERTAVLHLHVN